MLLLISSLCFGSNSATRLFLGTKISEEHYARLLPLKDHTEIRPEMLIAVPFQPKIKTSPYIYGQVRHVMKFNNSKIYMVQISDEDKRMAFMLESLRRFDIIE